MIDEDCRTVQPCLMMLFFCSFQVRHLSFQYVPQETSHLACWVIKTLHAPKSRRHLRTQRTCIRPAIKPPNELLLLLCFLPRTLKKWYCHYCAWAGTPRSSTSFAQWSSPLFQRHLVFLRWASRGRSCLTGLFAPVRHYSVSTQITSSRLLQVSHSLASNSAAAPPPQRSRTLWLTPGSPLSAPEVENWQSHLYHSCHVCLCLPDRRARWNKDGTKPQAVSVYTQARYPTLSGMEKVWLCFAFCYTERRLSAPHVLRVRFQRGNWRMSVTATVYNIIWCARLDMIANSCKGCIIWAEFTSWTSASRYPQVTPVWEEVMGSLLAVFTWRRWLQTSMDRTGWTWTT